MDTTLFNLEIPSTTALLAERCHTFLPLVYANDKGVHSKKYFDGIGKVFLHTVNSRLALLNDLIPRYRQDGENDREIEFNIIYQVDLLLKWNAVIDGTLFLKSKILENASAAQIAELQAIKDKLTVYVSGVTSLPVRIYDTAHPYYYHAEKYNPALSHSNRDDIVVGSSDYGAQAVKVIRANECLTKAEYDRLSEPVKLYCQYQLVESSLLAFFDLGRWIVGASPNGKQPGFLADYQKFKFQTAAVDNTVSWWDSVSVFEGQVSEAQRAAMFSKARYNLAIAETMRVAVHQTVERLTGQRFPAFNTMGWVSSTPYDGRTM